ncbi:MAG: hypothetical protein J6B96_06065, partial [Agathobacter sp.]|nr:hypothetical protein [Agathobacter sp.]
QRRFGSRMYSYKQKRARKKREAETSLNSLALRNARTFKLLSLRVRCIGASSLFLLQMKFPKKGKIILVEYVKIYLTAKKDSANITLS